MASDKGRAKTNSFQPKCQAWFYTAGLPSDIVVEVDGMNFHLHKFPLITRSGKLAKLVDRYSDEKGESCHVEMSDIPGGAAAFEIVSKFCYGVWSELTAVNVVVLRCAAHYLEMTEAYGENNLIARTEEFLNQILLRSWNESIRALQGCEPVLAKAEELGILQRCLDSIAMKACIDPNLFGWQGMQHGIIQSPGGSILWNGISTGAKPRCTQMDWWHEDVSVLSLPLFKKLVSVMSLRGIKQEVITGGVMHFATKYLPVLSRWHGRWPSGRRRLSTLSKNDQKEILETTEVLLPYQRGMVSTRFLCGLLRSAFILDASPSSRENLERRIGCQLDDASVEDLLFPNLSYSLETLYDIECIQRIVNHFLQNQYEGTECSPLLLEDEQFVPSPLLTPMRRVGHLMDAYLVEVASDVNLKLFKFQSLSDALPSYARLTDDGLYRAIDMYLKTHPWLNEQDQWQLSRSMDCRKLSLDACAHAAHNEHLPLRVVVQVLFFEQLQLRSVLAGSFFDTSPDCVANDEVLPEGLGRRAQENHVLKVDIDNMKFHVNELERECRSLRRQINKLETRKSTSCWAVSKALGSRFRSHICGLRQDAPNRQLQMAAL